MKSNSRKKTATENVFIKKEYSPIANLKNLVWLVTTGLSRQCRKGHSSILSWTSPETFFVFFRQFGAELKGGFTITQLKNILKTLFPEKKSLYFFLYSVNRLLFSKTLSISINFKFLSSFLFKWLLKKTFIEWHFGKFANLFWKFKKKCFSLKLKPKANFVIVNFANYNNFLNLTLKLKKQNYYKNVCIRSLSWFELKLTLCWVDQISYFLKFPQKPALVFLKHLKKFLTERNIGKTKC